MVESGSSLAVQILNASMVDRSLLALVRIINDLCRRDWEVRMSKRIEMLSFWLNIYIYINQI